LLRNFNYDAASQLFFLTEMQMTPLPDNLPHGGELVNLLVPTDRAAMLKQLAMKLPDINLNERQLCDLEMLATGAYSPLNGFMNRPDYESVCNRMRLQNGDIWPLPVCLDITDTQAQSLETGQSVALRDPEGFLLAVMHIEDIWPVAAKDEARQVYGTLDRRHPGVRHLLDAVGTHYLGGALEVISTPLHFDFKQIRCTPHEIRALQKKLGWQRVVGFHTRHPIHRPHFEMTIRAMRQARANLLLLPVTGMPAAGDFDHYTRVKCYRQVTRHYPPDSFILNLLPLALRMSGPRDALHQAIISRNYGCTHFIVEHDQGSPDRAENGDAFYAGGCARELTEKFSEETGVTVLPFEKMAYLPFEDEYRPADQVPEETRTIYLSGSDIRDRIRNGRRIPDWATFPEVVEELEKSYPPPQEQGFTIFLTGLSGAGKSTVAKVLYSRFLEMGQRPVSLLDGDIVRRHLSSQLSFSKEDRDTNIRRIGFVASEITKNRGVAICAPIAPYAATRLEIRQSIEVYGGFCEVHVRTPIEVCEKRDRKGMYAKARAGLIQGFTGVDDPYETPESPEVSIDTSECTPDEAAQEILLFLGERGYI
jgi:sulfate adenylyltransferase